MPSHAKDVRANAATRKAQKRSEMLLHATTGVGAIGLLGAVSPFVARLEPSAATLAAAGPVEIEVSSLAPGQLLTVDWRGKPVWLMRRTPAMVTALRRPDPDLVDPLSAASQQPRSCVNAVRSERPDLFVAICICPHLGCLPTLRLEEPLLQAELNAPGRFICPCHGSRFDLAGRDVKSVPAPTNLEIPDYLYTGPDCLSIG